MPRIATPDLNCCFYLYPTADAAKAGLRVGGCGFWVSIKSDKLPDYYWFYAVTNRHVVHSSGSCVIRANVRDGGAKPFLTEPTDWVEHPNGHDIAVLPVSVTEIRAGQIECISIPAESFVTEQHIQDQKVGVGDEAYMIGRFVNHEGKAKNTPAARFGNISMLPGEPIEIGIGSIPQESFAIELRSMSGYSGSPVFAVMSGFRKIGGDMKMSWDEDLLLGVQWGYIVEPWTVQKKIVKTASRSALRPGEKEIDIVASNTGMNGVVPAWRLRELLDLPIFKDRRDREEAMHVERIETETPSAQLTSATEVRDDSDLPATAANPNHRDDFTRLLGAAVKTPAPKD